MEQGVDETSPLARAIVAALHPWPKSLEVAYALVDDLLDNVRIERAESKVCTRELIEAGRALLEAKL